MSGDLGALLSEHRGKFLAGGWLWYVGGMLILAAGFTVVNGVGEMQRGEATLVQVLSMSSVSAAIGALLLVMPVMRWRQSVSCYEQGFVWKRLTGEKTVRRDEVRNVTMISHRSRYGSYDELEIVTASGTLSIKGIAEPQQLANHLRAWLGPAPAPAGAPAQGGGWSPPASGGGGWTPPT